jgi:hypothetical protein
MYNYLGYEYRPWDDVEEDNIKTHHECYKDGRRIIMARDFYNHSPYQLMDATTFRYHVQQIEVFVQG